MKLSVIAFESKTGETLEEQVSDCLDQLDVFISNASFTLKNIISINFFLDAGNAEVYHDLTRRLEKCLPAQIRTGVPVAFLAQAPANGALVSAEVCCITNLEDAEVHAKTEDGNLFLVIQNKKGEKLVIANGIGANNGHRSITEDAEEVFGVMAKILHSEGLDFSDIFRQWNYIENITAVESDERKSQHYQQFNNVRSDYYSSADFKQGYPAATGIGTRAGGVIVSFFAASPEGYHTIAVENPLQKAAFEYSGKVLVGDAEYRGSSKCTPKFARAKFVANHEYKQVFISGTASIREEIIVGEHDIARQTEITIENIRKLISRETLSALGRTDQELQKIEFIRVYIKYPEDYPVVKEVCEQRLPGVPGIYVVSDICRENLLVEIEALASA
jgi:enamine deaminase RidA (YjgF/YER057c/UK114 family)